MGLDNKTIRNVILWDLDYEKTAIWQKISRCCRDGHPGTAVIFTKATVNSDAGFLKPSTCLRKQFLSEFIGFVDEPKDCDISRKETCKLFNCCSNCRKNCECII